MLAWALWFLLPASQDRFAAEREKMVREQIEHRGVRNGEVLAAMRRTPRHMFVPKALEAHAYDDNPLPIGYGATISQPFIVAWMTELLAPDRTSRVLEVGTGSGYQAAVLAQLAKLVFTIEIVPELAKSAGALLADLGYRNIVVKRGDGYQGWAEEAPFDRILLTAAPPEVPQTLLDQLARGGRLVAPVGGRLEQQLVVIDKGRDGKIYRQAVGAVAFVPMVPGPHKVPQ